MKKIEEFKKVGYMVHLNPKRDDSIDLQAKHIVLSALLKNEEGIVVVNYLSYKSKPLVALQFISMLKEEGVDTVVVHDRTIFKKEVIKLFVKEGFHFIILEVNNSKTKYQIKRVSNNELNSSLHNLGRVGSVEWKLLSKDYKNSLIRSEKAARKLNQIIDEAESKSGLRMSAY